MSFSFSIMKKIFFNSVTFFPKGMDLDLFCLVSPEVENGGKDPEVRNGVVG